MPYTDIYLDVDAHGDNNYLVRVSGGVHPGVVVLAPNQHVGQTADRVKALLEIEFRNRSLDLPLPQDSLRKVGEDLFEGFFLRNNLWQILQRNLSAVRDNPVRLRIKIDPQSELAVQPWEVVFANQSFLARDLNLSVVRSLDGNGRVLNPITGNAQIDALDVIIVMANPDKDLGVEKQEISDCLRDLENIGRVNLTFITYKPGGRSLLDQLNDLVAIRKSDNPCVVHIVAHGDYQGEQGILWFEGPNGVGQPVTALILSGLLSGISGISLVVLNACHGGARSAAKPFSSIAERLIRAGIPAVVAMQFEVSNEAALLFAERFYESIASGFEIDKAVNLARIAMTQTRLDMVTNENYESIEWCTPAIYLNNHYRSTQLIQVPKVNALFDQADTWFKQGEYPAALSAYRLILRRGADNVQKKADRLKAQAAGLAHDNRIISLTREPQPFKEPAKIIAKCDYVLGDIPKLELISEIREKVEAQVREELLQLFKKGIDNAVRHYWGDAQSFFEKCAEQANKILRRARRCESAREYLRPAEIAMDFTCLFVHGEQYLNNGMWTEARNAFRNIIELRWQAYSLLTPLRPMFEESQRNLIYIDGREAESRDYWNDAMGIYQQLPPDFRDIKQRLPFASGRAAEKGDRWEEAAGEYRKLEIPYLDVYERLHYCQGRAAEVWAEWLSEWRGDEVRGAWRDVIEGFGDLDDAYRVGEVRKRRAYAQGRMAEAEEKWDHAIKNFEAALRGDFRKDDVEPRCDYAKGRLVFDAENWEDAKGLFEKLGVYRDAEYRCGYAQAMVDVKYGRFEQAIIDLKKLPDDFAETKQWRAYATGIGAEKVAEENGDWLGVVEAYQTLYENYQDWRDVRYRLSYAQGRLAEGMESWEEAIEHYRRCSSGFRGRDIADRLAYCSGRAADSREDWQGVIDGFGVLPYSYRDVGYRRAYARGRIAEGNEKWARVIEGFRLEGGGDLPDDYRDVGERRRYARGQLAAKDEDWAGVISGFGKAPGKYREGSVAKLRIYARGKLAETEERWRRAARAFRAVTPYFRDANERFAYAVGRDAADREKWSEAVAAFQSLPIDYLDVDKRMRYAQGRVALQAGQWAQAEQIFRELGNLRDAPRFWPYARGRAAAERGDWETVLSALSDLPARWREGDVAQWLCYAQGRLFEARGQWSAALEAYRLLPDDFPDASQDVAGRRQRLSHLLQVAPWMDGLARAHLARDPAQCWNGSAPYDALAPVGITPDSTAKEIKDASFVMMEKGLMTPEGRIAWDRLRGVKERLKVDALMRRLRCIEELRKFQQEVGIISAEELMRQAAQVAPEDAPLLLLLSGRRDKAVAEWERRQQQQPQETALAHALALAYISSAKELESKGAYEHADPIWKLAIANWAALLADDAYWRDWRDEREACYRMAISDNDLAVLRGELGNHLARELSQYADRYQTAGQSKQAERFHQLVLAFEVELEGARALKECGGLPVNHRPEAQICVGAIFIRRHGLEPSLADLSLNLERGLAREESEPGDIVDELARLEAVLEGAGGQPASSITTETLTRLRCAFSELGRSAVLLERHRYEDALQALPPDALRQKIGDLPSDCDTERRRPPEHHSQCEGCQSFKRLNPVYLYLPYRAITLLRDTTDLAIRIHLAAAQTIITSGNDNVAPFRHWEQAIAIARHAGTQVRAKQGVVRAALGRSSALEREEGRLRGQRLTEAIELLEKARELVGGVDEAQLKGEQSKLLTSLGIWHGYGCHRWGETPDYEKATGDLRRAVDLNPDSLHARDNLARSLIFYAANLNRVGKTRPALKLLADSFTELEEGLRRFGNHKQLQTVLRMALLELEETMHAGQGLDETMRNLKEVLSNAAPRAANVAENVEAIRERARQKLQSGEAAGAILDLIQAVRMQPDEPASRHALLDALRCHAGETKTGGNNDVQGSAHQLGGTVPI